MENVMISFQAMIARPRPADLSVGGERRAVVVSYNLARAAGDLFCRSRSRRGVGVRQRHARARVHPRCVASARIPVPLIGYRNGEATDWSRPGGRCDRRPVRPCLRADRRRAGDRQAVAFEGTHLQAAHEQGVHEHGGELFECSRLLVASSNTDETVMHQQK
jgi:hypothetical protein